MYGTVAVNMAVCSKNKIIPVYSFKINNGCLCNDKNCIKNISGLNR